MSRDVFTHLSVMQHPHPENVYSEFPPPPQSLHPHAYGLRQQDPIHSGPSQPTDRPTTASAAQNPYSLPMVMDSRFLASPAGTLSQCCHPYLSGSAPSGLLASIAHHPTVGFAQSNNYIGVLNIESPTRPRQSRKRKRDGDTASRKRKGNHNTSRKEVY